MSDQSAQTEQEIIRLTHEWVEAVKARDRATLERLLGDDFLIAGWLPEGKLGSREFYLEDCLKPVQWEQATYSFDQWQFRQYAPVVIANCLLTSQAVINGISVGGAFLLTYVWASRGNSWQAVYCHTSPVLNPQT